MEPRPPRRVTPDPCVPAAWGWARAPVKVGAEEGPQRVYDRGLERHRLAGTGRAQAWWATDRELAFPSVFDRLPERGIMPP